jgi:hypothetical protein
VSLAQALGHVLRDVANGITWHSLFDLQDTYRRGGNPAFTPPTYSAPCSELGRASGCVVGNSVENHRGGEPHCVGVALSAMGGFMGLMATLNWKRIQLLGYGFLGM